MKERQEGRKRGKDSGNGAKDDDYWEGIGNEKKIVKEEGSMIGAKSKVEVRHKTSMKRERERDQGTIKDRERGKDRDHSTTLRKPTIGKGLSGALQLLQHSGTLKMGRSMDKKKNNLIEIAYHNNGGGKEKEISLERRDRFNRILTPEESFRMLCYAFHGKGPG